jgi:hypothetical protein
MAALLGSEVMGIAAAKRPAGAYVGRPMKRAAIMKKLAHNGCPDNGRPDNGRVGPDQHRIEGDASQGNPGRAF